MRNEGAACSDVGLAPVLEPLMARITWSPAWGLDNGLGIAFDGEVRCKGTRSLDAQWELTLLWRFLVENILELIDQPTTSSVDPGPHHCPEAPGPRLLPA